MEERNDKDNRSLKIAAVGDIALVGRYQDNPSPAPFEPVRHLFKQCGLVIANLECPLTDTGTSPPGKCTLRANPGWAAVLKDAGVDVVSLANNHIMDYGPEGLVNTIRALDDAGIQWVGAGENNDQASQPLYLERAGYKIAILARSSVEVKSPCYADEHQMGAAFLDAAELTDRIFECRQNADLVLLLPHWGLEEYAYPPPTQRKEARVLIDSGADVIFGGHPHVLQGVEEFGEGFVRHSLGNFVFDEFEWSFINQEGNPQSAWSGLSRRNREGCVQWVEFRGKSLAGHEAVPTRITEEGVIVHDTRLCRSRDFARLSSRLKWPAYGIFWKLHSFLMEYELRIKPHFAGKLKWEKLKKIRPSHIISLVQSLRRSAKITSGKSTNPYD